MHMSLKFPLAFLTSLVVGLVVAAVPAMAEFGLQAFAVSARNQNGTPDVQAGSHPYALTNTFVLNVNPGVGGFDGRRRRTDVPAEGDLRDVRLELPPGFVGDPNATPHCSYQKFIHKECPNETAVGISTTYVTESGISEFTPTTDPVYNLVPPTGVAAEFGYLAAGVAPVFLDTSVRTGSDYGLTTTVSEISQAVLVAASKTTIWGVPADPVHNDVRGKCASEILQGANPYEELSSELKGTDLDPLGLDQGEDEVEGPIGIGSNANLPVTSEGNCPTQTPLVPLLTNPTSCGAPRTATLSVDDWEEPGVFHPRSASLPELSGCEKLDFSPTVDVTPDGTAGSTPTGLNVHLHVPQETTENPVGLAESDVRDTTVALPAGVQLSPGASDGLQACSNAQIGFAGFRELDPTAEPGVQTPQFTPTAPSCPNASKVANVSIKTPLLEHELEGEVYLAAPQNFAGLPENPFSSLVALYLVAEDPVSGVLVKVAGRVTPNPVTGQLVSTFENTPALPFSDLKLEFFGTDRAPLTTPQLCGTYGTEASFAPWSGGPAVTPATSFQITSGPNGAPCSDPPPFSPSLQSGTTNINAGSFSNLTTTLAREDGQQSLSSVQLHYPAGVSGLLSGVKLCSEVQANAGTCGPESEIGETIVSVGLGNDPFSVTGGKVYITGPYEGAPFGLSIVNPAKAGPFDLQEGRPVVVRARIEVNPHTAALTITTDPPGSPHAIPTIIEGIPLQIKHVNVNITRPGFTFNPSNCAPTAVTGAISSAEGASSPVSVPFQVTNCAFLKFTPKFTVSTSGKTSRAGGASLTAKVTEPSEAFGSQANISKVKVELPKQLPSRLTTLQKACTAAQFEANPAGCPTPSVIGHAKVITKLVPVPLEGPIYFVSHGGEAFPSLEIVLQGYGVKIVLVGATFISKAGITSTTFKTVPDQPFSTFELTLPEGKYSALAANGKLCGQKLVMPNEFIGQNGAAIHENTTISVTGCAKVKALTRAQKLANALKACRKKAKGKRAACKSAARKRFGAVKAKKKK
jgi:hypothetical protein